MFGETPLDLDLFAISAYMGLQFVTAHEPVVPRLEPDRPLDILAYQNFFNFLILIKCFCKGRMRLDRPALRVMLDRDFNDLSYPLW